jgi:hypothetical protein
VGQNELQTGLCLWGKVNMDDVLNGDRGTKSKPIPGPELRGRHLLQHFARGRDRVERPAVIVAVVTGRV